MYSTFKRQGSFGEEKRIVQHARVDAIKKEGEITTNPPNAVHQPGWVLYALPRARYGWDDEKQGVDHAVWGSMFFDIVFVGMASKLDLMMAKGISSNNTVSTLIVFVSIYLSMERQWNYKLMFDSRFVADDLFHRWMALVLGSIVSFQTSCIGDFNEMSHAKRDVIFTLCLLLYCVVDLIPFGELACARRSHTHAANVKRYGLVWGGSKVLQIVVTLVPALLNLFVFEGPFWFTVLCWFTFGIFPKLFIFLGSQWGNLFNKENMVPTNAEWSIERLGDFLLLMLGEAAINLFMVDFIVPSRSVVITYFFCYCLIAVLGLILFAAIPMDANKHAMRRNINRVFIYNTLVSIQGMSLVLVGSGLKLVLEHDPSEKITPQYAWFISNTLVVFYISVFASQLCHHGLQEEFFSLPTSQDRRIKYTFWVAKFLLLVAFWIVPNFHYLSSEEMMPYFCALAGLLYVVQLADLRYFNEYHNTLVELELFESQKHLFEEEEEEEIHHTNSMDLNEAEQCLIAD